AITCLPVQNKVYTVIKLSWAIANLTIHPNKKQHVTPVLKRRWS
mgnify:CR=1